MQEKTTIDVTMLLKALKEKKLIFNKLIDITLQQKELVTKEKLDMDLFEQLMDDKDICIKKINKLDSEFEKLYAEIGEVLKKEAEKNSTLITELKRIIGEISEKSSEIEELEKVNQKYLKEHFSKYKKEVKTFKESRTKVTSYYKNMSNTHSNQSYFFDSKK